MCGLPNSKQWNGTSFHCLEFGGLLEKEAMIISYKNGMITPSPFSPIMCKNRRPHYALLCQ